MATLRSGFTHIRICNDCGARIESDDACGCVGVSPFEKGTKVTICADEAGERILRVTTIARYGNGDFRVDGSDEWFHTVTRTLVHQKSIQKWVRETREGDEALVTKREDDRKMLAEIERLEKRLAESVACAADCRKQAAGLEREASQSERDAARVNPDALAEAQRAATKKKAEEQITTLLRKATEERMQLAAQNEQAEKHVKLAIRCRELLDALPPDVQTIRALGDREALRAYLLA